MSNKIGKPQNSGFISIESTEPDWIKFANSQAQIEFPTTALLDFSYKDEIIKGRVNLVINSIISPEFLISKTNLSFNGPVSKKVSLGMVRAKKHLIDSLDQNAWLFFGYIKGEKTRTYLLIIHYKIFNISVYSLKPKDEEVVAFYGENLFNPQNN